MMNLLKKDTRQRWTFSTDLSLNNYPSTYGRYKDSENQNLHLLTIHETYPSVLKQSLII